MSVLREAKVPHRQTYQYKKILNIIYIFLFGSGQSEGFIHESETEPIRSEKWTQPYSKF